MESEQQTIAQQLKKIDHDIQSMNAEEDLIEARSQLAATAAQLQADFAVQKEQVEHLRQKIAANAEALAENESTPTVARTAVSSNQFECE